MKSEDGQSSHNVTLTSLGWPEECLLTHADVTGTFNTLVGLNFMHHLAQVVDYLINQ